MELDCLDARLVAGKRYGEAPRDERLSGTGRAIEDHLALVGKQLGDCLQVGGIEEQVGGERGEGVSGDPSGGRWAEAGVGLAQSAASVVSPAAVCAMHQSAKRGSTGDGSAPADTAGASAATARASSVGQARGRTRWTRWVAG